MGRVGEEITLRSGEKVYTADIENSICERKEVVECAVIAFESKERGQVPLAFVVLRSPPADEKDIELAKPESEKEEERR